MKLARVFPLALAAACAAEPPLYQEATGQETTACDLVPADEALALIDRGENELLATSNSETACTYRAEPYALVQWEVYPGADYDDLVEQLDEPNLEELPGVGDRSVIYTGVTSGRLATAHVVSARGEDLLRVVVGLEGSEPPKEAAVALAERVWARSD